MKTFLIVLGTLGAVGIAGGILWMWWMCKAMGLGH